MTCNCKNVGTIDRAFRALIGIAALVLAFTVLNASTGAIGGIIAAVAGVIMLLTSAMGMCPLYIPLKISTNKASCQLK